MTFLADLMAERNLSVPDLCRQAKLHAPDAYQIRKGVRSVGPTVRQRIAVALKVDETDLFDEDGWPIEAATAG
jgi:transcriptional regulator with XRE-family HTH domain